MNIIKSGRLALLLFAITASWRAQGAEPAEARDRFLHDILARADNLDLNRLRDHLAKTLNEIGMSVSDQHIRNAVMSFAAARFEAGAGASPAAVREREPAAPAVQPAPASSSNPGEAAGGAPAKKDTAAKIKDDKNNVFSDKGIKPLSLDVLGPFDFGAGIGFMVDLGSQQRVSNATVDSAGVIRGDEEDNLSPKAILETHIFPWRIELPFGRKTELNFGPYIGVVPGGDKVISAIGGGLMANVRRIAENPEAGTKAGEPPLKQAPGSFQLGVGVMVEPGVQVLGSGLQLDQPVPANDSLRFRDKDILGIQVVFSLGY